MLQHIGTICEAKFAKGDAVKMGQVLSDSDKPLSAPSHSSVLGKDTDISKLHYPGGFRAPTIEIETDGFQKLSTLILLPSTKTMTVQRK